MTERQVPPAALNRPTDESAAPRAVKRRRFLSWIALGWLAFAGATGGFLTMIIRFLFPNVLFEPPQSFKVGFPADFQLGEVDERFKASRGIWIVREPDGLFALSTICTHLGCTPNWLITDGKFKCPCHGSGFRKSGINFEGPAPRPLERYKILLAEDGQILIDKSTKYQYEKGQWGQPDAYLEV